MLLPCVFLKTYALLLPLNVFEDAHYAYHSYVNDIYNKSNSLQWEHLNSITKHLWYVCRADSRRHCRCLLRRGAGRYGRWHGLPAALHRPSDDSANHQSRGTSASACRCLLLRQTLVDRSNVCTLAEPTCVVIKRCSIYLTDI